MDVLGLHFKVVDFIGRVFFLMGQLKWNWQCWHSCIVETLWTRMHSSRMRTGRALTVSGGASQKDFFGGKRNWKKKKKKLEEPPRNFQPPEKLETPRDQTTTTPPLTESQTRVKIIPWPNFVAASKNPYVMGRMGCIPILPVKRYGDGDKVARCEWAVISSSRQPGVTEYSHPPENPNTGPNFTSQWGPLPSHRFDVIFHFTLVE